MRLLSSLAAAWLAMGCSGLVGSRPHLLLFVADDLGFHDVGYAEQPRAMARLATPFLTELAEKRGIVMERHYAHWHCSPARRSLMTGRLPIHVGGDNSTHVNQDDDMDVRFTWLSEKLASAGYTNLFFGKHHMGAKTVQMLPLHRGFHYHMGFLGGADTYDGTERWLNRRPSKNKGFSTQVWADSMHRQVKKVIQSKDDHDRVFLFASWQTPHAPMVRPPKKYQKSHKKMNLLDHNMLALDAEIKRVIKLFMDREDVWSNTLVVFISDNGGTVLNNFGNNWPLRSEKGSSFEGAFRTTGFVSGGLVPRQLWGTKNKHIIHISDWYRTFCNLAGVDADDASPHEMAFPHASPDDVLDPHHPSVKRADGTSKDVYGNAFPGVDSMDVWPVLMRPNAFPRDSLHPSLVLSHQVMLYKGRYKLVLAQPCAKGIMGDLDCKDHVKLGWVSANDFRKWERHNPSLGCLAFDDERERPGGFQFQPCLFDLEVDPAERSPLQSPQMLDKIWLELNRSLVFQYNTKLEGKKQGMSPPDCIGVCMSAKKAAKKWRTAPGVEVPLCGLDHIDDDDLSLDFCPGEEEDSKDDYFSKEKPSMVPTCSPTEDSRTYCKQLGNKKSCRAKKEHCAWVPKPLEQTPECWSQQVMAEWLCSDYGRKKKDCIKDKSKIGSCSWSKNKGTCI